MRILFICGSLAPGRDGVGDYTRRLAAECLRQGVDCRVAAINDKHLAGPEPVYESQPVEATPVPCLRLPRSMCWRDRVDVARTWRREFGPDIVSLQFVPYSFHDKGLPFGLPGRLRAIIAYTPWHVMFHELWIGMDRGASPRAQAIGMLQRQLITRLAARRPVVCHTHCELYRVQLERIGVACAHLPLFGNIPVVPTSQRGGPNGASRRVAVFGGIQHSAPIDTFAGGIADLDREGQQRTELHLVGRNGSEKPHWLDAFRRAGLHAVDHGEQPAAEVSRVLQSCDIGVASTPSLLLQKSGSVAAMLEHGLPVICVARDWSPRFPLEPPSISGVVAYQAGRLAECFKVTPSPPSNQLSQVARRFMGDLQDGAQL